MRTCTSDAGVTTTAGTDTSLKNITTDLNGVALAIPATSTIRIVFSIRKGSGAANVMQGRVGLNTTNFMSAAGRAWTAATNGAGDGQVVVIIGPRATNYQTSGALHAHSYDGAEFVADYSATTANWAPTTTITDIQINGQNNGGSITVGVANVKVYEELGG